MPPFPKTFADMHPALVHFPIACFFVALLLEWIALVRRHPAFQTGTAVVLGAGIAVGAAAILSGFLFADDKRGGLPDSALVVLDRHQWSGIAAASAAVLAFVAGILWRRGPAPGKRVAYLVLLHLSAAAVGVAGAYGGGLVWD